MMDYVTALMLIAFGGVMGFLLGGVCAVAGESNALALAEHEILLLRKKVASLQNRVASE